MLLLYVFFFSSRRLHTIGALVTGVQTCALPISRIDVSRAISPIKDENGVMTAASTVARDVTERRRADDHRGLLVAELDHRVKNMLAVVSSLAAQTLRTAGSPENFVTTFQGRLKALSQVQIGRAHV